MKSHAKRNNIGYDMNNTEFQRNRNKTIQSKLKSAIKESNNSKITERYSFVNHRILPTELKDISNKIKSSDKLHKQMIDNCKINKKSKLSKPHRHHFIFDETMGLDCVVEKLDTWRKDYPSKYFVKRTFKDKNGKGKMMVELTELFMCRDCEVFSWSDNRILIDYDIFSLFNSRGLV
jgi:hypothetical protein